MRHASKLSVYRRSEDYEVVGLVEPDDRLREGAKSREVYQGLPWMTREQLLNVPGLQAVLVETRVRDLLDTAEACVGAGLHVHLDKPAGESLAQYRRILEAAARKSLWVQMGYMYRYNPAVVLLRDVLRRGWLGDVFEVHAVMSKVVGPDERKALAEYRGGIMFELGCHVIDLVVGVLGAPTKVTPHARHSSKLDDALAGQHARRVRLSRRHRHGEIQRPGSRRIRAPAPRGLWDRGNVSYPAARQPLGPRRLLDRTRNLSQGLPGRVVPEDSPGTWPTPPTWPASSAARRRSTSPRSTISLCRRRCSRHRDCRRTPEFNLTTMKT